MHASPMNPDASGILLRAALAGGIAFLLWGTWRGLCAVFWTAFGLGMAAYWTGGLHGF